VFFISVRFSIFSEHHRFSGDINRLERLKKYCSHSVLKEKEAVFLVFGFVSAQLQVF